LHEVTLNCLVPNVPNSFLIVVPWHIPLEAELLQFIAYDGHMCAGNVVVTVVSGMYICIFGYQVQHFETPFHASGLGAISLCSQPHSST
jgi:formylmethanofuran dehydrogenase subunit E-like metal-binding protein